MKNLFFNESSYFGQTSKNMNSIYNKDIKKRRIRNQKQQWSLVFPEMENDFEENEKYISQYGVKTFEWGVGEEEAWNKAYNSIFEPPKILTQEEKEKLVSTILPDNWMYSGKYNYTPNVEGLSDDEKKLRLSRYERATKIYKTKYNNTKSISTFSLYESPNLKTFLQIFSIDDERFHVPEQYKRTDENSLPLALLNFLDGRKIQRGLYYLKPNGSKGKFYITPLLKLNMNTRLAVISLIVSAYFRSNITVGEEIDIIQKFGRNKVLMKLAGI